MKQLTDDQVILRHSSEITFYDPSRNKKAQDVLFLWSTADEKEKESKERNLRASILLCWSGRKEMQAIFCCVISCIMKNNTPKTELFET